jgi:hypothetical protein
MNEKEEILLTKATMVKKTRLFKTDETSPSKCHLKQLLTHPKKRHEKKKPFVRKGLRVFQNKATASIGAVVRVNVFKFQTAC